MQLAPKRKFGVGKLIEFTFIPTCIEKFKFDIKNIFDEK